MNEILIFAGFVVLTSTSAVGLWVLGRYLRSKGYGPQLDKLNRQFTAIQLRIRPLALSASYRMFAGTQILNRLPLLGSKSSVALNHQVLIAIQAVQEAQKREKPNNR